MARKTCGKPNGHSDAADRRTQGLEKELRRVNEMYNALILEKGPRCSHPADGHDERNVRLLERHGKAIATLTAQIIDLKAQLAPYLARDQADAKKRRRKVVGGEGVV